MRNARDWIRNAIHKSASRAKALLNRVGSKARKALWRTGEKVPDNEQTVGHRTHSRNLLP